MAKRARAPKAIPNTAHPEIVNSILDRWDTIQEKRLSDLGSYRSQCKEHKRSEKDLMTEAKARGIDPELLKADIRRRKLQRDIREIETAIEREKIADWEAICEATKERDAAKPTAAEQEREDESSGNADAFDDFTNDND